MRAGNGLSKIPSHKSYSDVVQTNTATPEAGSETEEDKSVKELGGRDKSVRASWGETKGSRREGSEEIK